MRYVPKSKETIVEERQHEEAHDDFEQIHEIKGSLSLEMEGIIKELIDTKLIESEVKASN